MDDIDIAKYLEEGESLGIEYKEDSSGELSEKKICECAVALANTSGGVLLIGVTDTGKLKGAKSIGNRWSSPQDVISMIEQKTSPTLRTNVTFCPLQGCRDYLC